MSKRYWVPQFCHKTKGWIDLPGASYKQKEADAIATEIALLNNVATRSIRKPKGWIPEEVMAFEKWT